LFDNFSYWKSSNIVCKNWKKRRRTSMRWKLRIWYGVGRSCLS